MSLYLLLLALGVSAQGKIPGTFPSVLELGRSVTPTSRSLLKATGSLLYFFCLIGIQKPPLQNRVGFHCFFLIFF